MPTTIAAAGGISFGSAMELCTRHDEAGRYEETRTRRAVHLDRTYIGERKREALAYAASA